MTRRQYGNCTLILNQILNYLVENEVLESNVFSRLKIKSNQFRKVAKAPSETQVFMDKEREDLIALATKRAFEDKDENFLAIPMMFMTGLRVDECLALCFSDFDMSKNTLFIHASLKPVEEQNEDGTWKTRRYEYKEYLKGNADPSYIDIPDACDKLLQQIRFILKSKSIVRDRLFNVVTPNAIEMKLYRLCDSLGITRRSPHKERKTYISNLINNGADLDYARTQARHKDVNTTLKSYVYSTSTKEEKLALLNEVL